MLKKILIVVVLFALQVVLLNANVFAQSKKKEKEKEEEKSIWEKTDFSGLEFRSVGPAFMAGRIADIAIHPKDDNVWYVAVGSGGLWKTTNAGITWKPIFDDQKVYSTGCVTIDPTDNSRVWLGTGENVGGRHASWGNGIYLSEDEGKSWKNMGLGSSEHISKIIVHPDDKNIVWVASQGPLWSSGGERGVFKTIDGGKTWKNVLAKDEWTGATDLLIDHTNPNVLYAAMWQHHRTVAAYMGGGPESGIFKSEDAGETWIKLKSGLPEGNMGKIGLAISPQNEQVLYAAIELNLKEGGVYRSENKGASWKKMSDEIAKGTGPHYYQELYACPHNFDRIYFANNYFRVSNDGGKTFKNVPKKWKHVDNHALVFRKDDPDYLLVGTDGGLYESFDKAENWRHFSNMPITQYYKLAVDDAEPFYNIYGGTQDNNTQGGPSRTDKRAGIDNGDWKIVMGGDGHQPACEPGNPDIMYAQWQEGNYYRIDLKTGESLYIKPQAGAGENYERYNWDAPILISPFAPTTLYVASQRLWKSTDRGDSWTAISEDLTRNENRFELPIMGRVQSYNNAWDVYAMSNYNTITSISESPQQENLLYVGTDDGLLSVSENAGETWSKMELNSIARGVPQRAYVNDIKADLYDANTVYMAMDNHKEGDYKAYLFKSNNKGKSWTDISSNLPDTTIVWRIVQDHINPNVLFVGTEFGIYFTPNSGGEWIKLNGKLPTISFRDLAIQKREDDLVAASFGRSFYVYDDIAALRAIDEDALNKDAVLFELRDADWYQPKREMSGSLGANDFRSKNPPFGAVFTYYLKDGYKTLKDKRIKEEKELNKNKRNIPFPGWDVLEAERREQKPTIWLTIKDADDIVIRNIECKNKKGFHRVAWDLENASNEIILSKDTVKNPGLNLVLPGKYSATLTKIHNDEITELSDAVYFDVVKLREGALPGKSDAEKATFFTKHNQLINQVDVFETEVKHLKAYVKNAKKAAARSKAPTGYLSKEFYDLQKAMEEFNVAIKGNPSKNKPGEKTNPTIWNRLWFGYSSAYSTYGPTETAQQSLQIAEGEYEKLKTLYQQIQSAYDGICAKLKAVDAPYFEGMR